MTDDWEAIVAQALQDGDSDSIAEARERVRGARPAATTALVRAIGLGIVKPTLSEESGFEFLLWELRDSGCDAAMPLVRDFFARVDCFRTREVRDRFYSAAVGYVLEFASTSDDLRFLCAAIESGTYAEKVVSCSILSDAKRFQRDHATTCQVFAACLRAYRSNSADDSGQLLSAMLALDPASTERECFPHGELPTRPDQRDEIVSAYSWPVVRSVPTLALSGLADALRETLVLESGGINNLRGAWRLLRHGGSSQYSELVALGLAAGSPSVRHEAMEARLAGLGLEDWEERLYAMTRGIPWLAAGADRPQCLDDVPFCREQAMALVAFEILGSVSNGGLYNIYGNGAYWMRFDYRLEAFEAIGAYEVAALIRDVDRIVGVDLTDGSYDAVEARARAVSKQLFPSEELTKFFVLTPEAYYLASRYVFENRDRIERNLPTREESRG